MSHAKSRAPSPGGRKDDEANPKTRLGISQISAGDIPRNLGIRCGISPRDLGIRCGINLGSRLVSPLDFGIMRFLWMLGGADAGAMIQGKPETRNLKLETASKFPVNSLFLCMGFAKPRNPCGFSRAAKKPLLI